MTAKKRSLILSVLTLMLCVALFAVGTYALFSDEVELKNHLEAGKLNITLTRTHLLSNSLDEQTGDFVHKENPEDIDFTGENKRNVFDIIKDRTLIIPRCWYMAEMKISNNSDVTFGYWLEIVFDNKDNLALADQLKITIVTEAGTTEGSLSELSGKDVGHIGDERAPIGTLAVTESEIFTLKVEFEDREDNNAAKKQSVSFDVIVHAVQIPSSPKA